MLPSLFCQLLESTCIRTAVSYPATNSNPIDLVTNEKLLLDLSHSIEYIKNWDHSQMIIHALCWSWGGAEVYRDEALAGPPQRGSQHIWHIAVSFSAQLNELIDRSSGSNIYSFGDCCCCCCYFVIIIIIIIIIHHRQTIKNLGKPLNYSHYHTLGIINMM